jgi:anti-sigma-K factor RskA
MNSNERHPEISQWMLEAALLGELSDEDQRKVDSALAADPALRAELDRLKASNSEILANNPPDEVAQEIRRRADLLRASRERAQAKEARPAKSLFSRLSEIPALRMPILAPAAGLALLLVVAIPRMLPTRGGSDTESVNLKGAEARLFVYRQGTGGMESLNPGDSAIAGEVLQLFVQSPAQPYIAVLSIDGGGKVTRLWPADGESAARLAGKDKVSLPQSYRLDEAPGFERFFLVTSAASFPVSEAIAAAAALAGNAALAKSEPMTLGPPFGQASFLIEKAGVARP